MLMCWEAKSLDMILSYDSELLHVCFVAQQSNNADSDAAICYN